MAYPLDKSEIPAVRGRRVLRRGGPRLLAVITVLAAAFWSALPAGAQDAPTGTIRMGIYEGGLVQGLLPWNSFGQDFLWNMAAQKLLSVAPDGTIVHDLAASHEISPDGKTYTFTLVDGATWHDGEPVTAEDVAFTYNTMLKPDAGSNTSYKLAKLVGADAVADDQSLDAEGIKVIDDRTISFTFTEPNAGLLSTTFGNSFIAPRHVFEGLALADYQTRFQTDFIGSGPYRVIEYQYDQGATLEADPDYTNGTGYSGPPGAARVAMRMFADANAQLLAAEGGEIDFTYYRQPSGDTLARFAAIAGMTVVPSPVGFNVFYSIPYKDRPWANREFRQALAYATDRVTMAEINGGSAASRIVNDWTAEWAVSPDLEPYDYDLDRARELLEASGFDTSQVLDVRIYPYAATPDEIPVLLDTWRNELGLQITERPFTSDGFVKEFYEDFDYDIGFVYGFGTLDGQPYGSDVTNGCQSTYPTGFNGVAYCNEEWDAEFAAGLAAPTQAEQATHFQRASEIWNADLPYFPYFNRVDAAIVSDKLTGIENMQMFHPSAGGGRYWEWGISE